jgi:hypothetical protein
MAAPQPVGEGGRTAHGRSFRTRAFAAGASALTFLVTVGVLAVHDQHKAGATTDVNTTNSVGTTPTTTLTPESPFDDGGVNPFTGRATPGRSGSSSAGGFNQPDTSTRGS